MSNMPWCDAPREVGDHRVRRIDRVLVVHRRRDDRRRALLTGREVGVRVEGEGDGAARERCGVVAARRAMDREPGAERVDRLGERDGDIRRRVDVGRACGGDRRRDGRRRVGGGAAFLRRARGVDDEVGAVVVGVLRPGRSADVAAVEVRRAEARKRCRLLVGGAGAQAHRVDDRVRRGEQGDPAVVGDARPVALVPGHRAAYDRSRRWRLHSSRAQTTGAADRRTACGRPGGRPRETAGPHIPPSRHPPSCRRSVPST